MRPWRPPLWLTASAGALFLTAWMFPDYLLRHPAHFVSRVARRCTTVRPRLRERLRAHQTKVSARLWSLCLRSNRTASGACPPTPKKLRESIKSMLHVQAEKASREAALRTFVGFRLHADIQATLWQKLQDLKADGQADGRLVRAEKLHVTLKFIGDTPKAAIQPLLQELQASLSHHRYCPCA